MPTDKQDESLLPVDAAQPARKRTRISKVKEDHVYQANTDGQGERFDTEEQKKAAKKATPAIFAIDPATLVPPRKNRGRPSKAYLEAMEEYNRQLSLFQELKEEALGAEGVQKVQSPAGVQEVQEPAELRTENKEEAKAETKEEPQTETKTEAKTEIKEEATTETKEETKAAVPVAIPVNDRLIILRDIPSIEEELARVGKPKFRRFCDDPSMAQGSQQPTRSGLDRGNTNKNATQFSTSGVSGGNTPIDIVVKGSGVLELEKDNSGYLRSGDYNYLPSPDDIIVPQYMVRQYGLRTGDTVEGLIRLPHGSERAYIMTAIQQVNGLDAKKVRDRVPFENLTPLFPEDKFQLCSGEKDSLSCRIVDLFSPIGKGQRALIVAQPKTGKTLLMKDVANAIARNHPDTHLIMLLIDERPEEVTDMARTVDAEVIASTFDEPASQHVRIANIVLEKAKRMVECGHDVVIFLDSITRLARAYNTVAPASGKILTGGVDANALQKPKRFFGAARNIEGGGSLTIIATALIETGSKMDEVIFEEFKGTGNMELQLERALANKRMFPAVNLMASSTRRDELLHDEMTQSRMWGLRNYISDMNPIEAMKFLRQRIENTKDNKEFIISINS
ncbi:MAG: transcription termination factor Rho [Bacteroidaceae bacterium]|nr:transcription termination factor Rho [Bacteroidaceae bacterium]